jgi:leucyl-tRNA synthetase
MLLLTRIQDFEERAGERREALRVKDEEAVAAALLLLVQMIAPLTPHIAEELWSLAGNESLLAAAPWPREVATEIPVEEEAEAVTTDTPREAKAAEGAVAAEGAAAAEEAAATEEAAM